MPGSPVDLLDEMADELRKTRSKLNRSTAWNVASARRAMRATATILDELQDPIRRRRWLDFMTRELLSVVTERVSRLHRAAMMYVGVGQQATIITKRTASEAEAVDNNSTQADLANELTQAIAVNLAIIERVHDDSGIAGEQGLTAQLAAFRNEVDLELRWLLAASIRRLVLEQYRSASSALDTLVPERRAAEEDRANRPWAERDRLNVHISHLMAVSEKVNTCILHIDYFMHVAEADLARSTESNQGRSIKEVADDERIHALNAMKLMGNVQNLIVVLDKISAASVIA